jgi:HAD superfamily hydrolase (TIGR01490 family)
MEITSSVKSDGTKGYVVFFDLDRTITKAISGSELVKGALKRKLLTKGDFVNALFMSLLYKFNLMDPVKIVNKMVTWTKGMSEDDMDKLCSEVYSDILLPSVFDDARAEINEHKKRGDKVIILSSALQPICERAAKDLGMDDILCSTLETKDGYLTGLPVGFLCFDVQKEVRLREYCERNGIPLTDTWYYGDSVSDLYALNTVTHPVCVNPEKRLLKIAQKKGWRVEYWS